MKLTKKQISVMRWLNWRYPTWAAWKDKELGSLKRTLECLFHKGMIERRKFQVPWKLSSEGKIHVDRIIAKELWTQKYGAEKYPKVVEALEEAVKMCGYRKTSPPSWSPQSNDITYGVADEPCAESETDKVWHKRNTWSTMVTTQKWRVRKNWLNIPEELRTLAGMVTLERNQRTGEARWVRQSRGTSLVIVEGYILQYEGCYAHGATAIQAIRAAKRQARADAMKSTEQLKGRDAREYTLRMDSHVPRDHRITLNTSHVAGNCDSGTRSWAWKNIPMDMRRGYTTYGKLREMYVAGCDEPRNVLLILKHIQRQLAQQRKERMETDNAQA